jgi:hypothetical protein
LVEDRGRKPWEIGFGPNRAASRTYEYTDYTRVTVVCPTYERHSPFACRYTLERIQSAERTLGSGTSVHGR